MNNTENEDLLFIEGSTLIEIADAIREKKGLSEELDPAKYAELILSIAIGSSNPDATHQIEAGIYQFKESIGEALWSLNVYVPMKFGTNYPNETLYTSLVVLRDSESIYYGSDLVWQGGWVDDAYRLIEVTEPANVTKAFYDAFTENVTQLQRLIVKNVNNPAETVTFYMPKGYTFDDFIGSEYDTTEGAFTTSIDNVFYKGYYVRMGCDGGGAVKRNDIADGLFSYHGEMSTLTIVSITSGEPTGAVRSYSAPYATIGDFINSGIDEAKEFYIEPGRVMYRFENLYTTTSSNDYVKDTHPMNSTVYWIKNNEVLITPGEYYVHNNIIGISGNSLSRYVLSFTSKGEEFVGIEVFNYAYDGTHNVYYIQPRNAGRILVANSSGWYSGRRLINVEEQYVDKYVAENILQSD